jgi:radical SAM protein with 4Fe4S-binding SPASM domain
MCHSIFESVDQIVLSIDSEVPDVYESIRYGADFKKVLNNVKLLNRIRDQEYPETNTRIRVSGVKIRDDQNPESFMKFWSHYADEVTMGGAEERWDTYNNPPHPQITNRCKYPWERFYVWYDGTCNPCDVDYKSLLSPGDLEGKTISEIWNSEKLNQLRSDHMNGDRNKHNPCDRCQVQI